MYPHIRPTFTITLPTLPPGTVISTASHQLPASAITMPPDNLVGRHCSLLQCQLKYRFHPEGHRPLRFRRGRVSPATGHLRSSQGPWRNVLEYLNGHFHGLIGWSRCLTCRQAWPRTWTYGVRGLYSTWWQFRLACEREQMKPRAQLLQSSLRHRGRRKCERNNRCGWP